MRDNIKWGLMAVAVLYILYLHTCELKAPDTVVVPEDTSDTTETERWVARDRTPLPAPAAPVQPIIVQLPPAATLATGKPFDWAQLEAYLAARDAGDLPPATDDDVQLSFYQDSVADDTAMVYFDAVVDGQLLDWRGSYRLLQPQVDRVITNINYVAVPQPRHGFYLTTEVGGNAEAFSASLGAMYLTKKRIGFGYRYDFVNDGHYLTAAYRIR